MGVLEVGLRDGSAGLVEELGEGEAFVLEASLKRALARAQAAGDRRGGDVAAMQRLGDRALYPAREVVARRELGEEAGGVILEHGEEGRIGSADGGAPRGGRADEAGLGAAEAHLAGEDAAVLVGVGRGGEGELDRVGGPARPGAGARAGDERREGVLLRRWRESLGCGAAHDDGGRWAIPYGEDAADVDQGKVARDALERVPHGRAVGGEEVDDPVRAEGEGHRRVEGEVRIAGLREGRLPERIGLPRGEAAVGVVELFAGEVGRVQERAAIEPEALACVEDGSARDGEDRGHHCPRAYQRPWPPAATIPPSTRQEMGNQSPRVP